MAEPDREASGAVDWATVLEAEYEALYGEKPFPQGAPAGREARLRALHLLFHQRRPTALCLSGGGIRSATFGLGVLQGLAHVGVLDKFDYLSTVSGGGYIGGWLTSWLHRDDRGDVLRGLDPAQASAIRGEAARVSPVDRLRATCRYLAPQGGVVSADVWTLLATMGRNLLLNWLVLLPLLAAVLLVPRLYLATVSLVEVDATVPGPCLAAGTAPFWFLLVSLSMFVVAIGYVVMNFVGRGDTWPQGRFLSFVLLPTVLGTVGLTLFWSAYPCSPNETAAIVISALIPAAGWLVVGAISRSLRRSAPAASERTVRMNWGVRTVIAAAVAGPVVGLGMYWFAHKYFEVGGRLGESYAVAGVPAILGLMLLSNTVFLGIASHELSDAALEWWSRFAAWLAIAAALWLGAGVLVFYLADFIELIVRRSGQALSLEHRTSSALFSVLIPLLSSLAGFAVRTTGAVQGRPSVVRLAVQKLALPFVIVTLLATVAWFNGWALRGFHAPVTGEAPPGVRGVLAYGALLLGLGLLMSRFVPVNRFSLNGMYRQRLIRTFLGASHRDRQPNAFTGFDPSDDLRVHELKDVRPLHVINATLNNVRSTSVGRLERKAYAFTFSPFHVGSSTLGYRRSSEYGSDGGSPASGLSLGTALSVSGAAASPAMGIYTSKARAFLLTLANARLGLWFGNPKDPVTWQRSDPTLGVGPIVRELLGLTSDVNPYVYLSDGGHFENLGLWSMVARRCGVIIVSDAGCDPDYTFADLSNAVRSIRVDLGIPIEFASLDLSKAGQGVSNPHGAIGRIRYGIVDGPDAPDGVLLYVKATLSGDEPVDIFNFALQDPVFPHDSTSDQFFSEERFESYRTLGFHSILSLAGEVERAVAGETFSAAAAAHV